MSASRRRSIGARGSRRSNSSRIIRGWQPTIVDENGAAQLNGMRVSWNYFRMLGVRPALGRDFEEPEDAPTRLRVVMLSDGLWRRRFGARADIAGSTITLNGVPYIVAGVMPATFEPVISAHYYSPAELWGPLGYACGRIVVVPIVSAR